MGQRKKLNGQNEETLYLNYNKRNNSIRSKNMWLYANKLITVRLATLTRQLGASPPNPAHP